MDVMLGTFDKANRCFVVEREEFRKVTGKQNVRMSIRRLRKFYPDCPNDERGARPFWNRYLKSVLLAERTGNASPLRERIVSLERYIADFKEQGRDTTALEKELVEARFVPEHDIDHSDSPAIHPDMRSHAELLEATGDLNEVTTRFLNTLVPKRIPKAESLKTEVDAYLDRRTQSYKNKKAVLLVKQYLNLFLEITGEIKPEQITRQHYEAYHQKVIQHKTWLSKRSKANAMQRLNSFLKQLETVNTTLHFGFRHADDFKVKGANVGQKKQWTIEELQSAIKLSKDEPRVRFALLMAINTGAYWGDLMKPKGQYHGFQKDDIKGEYLSEVSREKNNTKDRITKGTWWLFPETRKALLFGLSKFQLESSFTAFRDEHGLPKFLDIRKTISQLIHDDIGETEARLWRCEELEGCIGSNYVRMFSEEQIADLKRALVYVRGILIEGKPRRDRRGRIRKQG